MRKLLKNFLRSVTPPALWSLAHYFKKRLCASRSSLFDGDGSEFEKAIRSCRVYGEYGCGASTSYVYQNSQAEVYLVDTSRQWIGSVLCKAQDQVRIHAKWVDVGELKNWGCPAGYSKRDNFALYTNWIWGQSQKPDVVLVDGRFRVACFLTSLIKAEVGTTIIFDDYKDRLNYHVVEEVVGVKYFCGRQAFFIVPEKDELDLALAGDLLEKFRYVLD